VVKDLSQDKGVLEGHRERDLEKEFRPKFQEYEEWRASQQGEEPELEKTPASTSEQKKGFGKLDLVFLGVGFLVAMLWRGCKGS
jgi:hypothetical protein